MIDLFAEPGVSAKVQAGVALPPVPSNAVSINLIVLDAVARPIFAKLCPMTTKFLKGAKFDTVT